MPKVSIIVPVYNVEKYLRECLESLVNQTLKDIEIICVNDGSTDSSLSILKEYEQKDDRVKVIDKANSGYGATMNIGLNNAKGEYIGIVESDDFANLDMFEKLYDVAIKNNADIVKSDLYYYTKESGKRKAGKISKNLCDRVFEAKDKLSIFNIFPSIWSGIYKRELLNENNIRFLETQGASYQDTSFSFKVFSCAKRIKCVRDAYINYRFDNDCSSVKQKNKVFAVCDEYDELTRFLNENPEKKQAFNTPKLICQYKSYEWNVRRISDEYKDEFIDRFQSEFKKFLQDGEINKDFYKRVKKCELNLLLKDKNKYKKLIEVQAKILAAKQKRRKLFSIRINSSMIGITLFGIKIFEK